MLYNEFKKEVIQRMKRIMKGKADVMLTKVVKNNNVELDGLSIIEYGKNISPAIYINGYYEEYLDGKSIEEILKQIMEFYQKEAITYNVDVSFFTKFEKAGKMLVYKLINYEKNKELLKEIPHIPVLDLAIVFYCVVSREDMGNASILVKNEHQLLWGKTTKELYETAKENTPKLLPFDLRTMEEVMKEVLYSGMREQCMQEAGASFEKDVREWIEEIEHKKEAVPMFVLSNKSRLQGAACMLYPQVLKRFAMQMQRDLFILPSSIHEVLIVPAGGYADLEHLKEMVREVNATQVSLEEILSNDVYLYSWKKGELFSEKTSFLEEELFSKEDCLFE